MTNEELYKDEVEKIMKEDDTRHPAVRNGKPVSCIGIACRDCDLHNLKTDVGCSSYYRDWLKSEAEPGKPVPKDEIKVGDTDGWVFTDREIEKVKRKKVKTKKTPPCIVVYRDGDTVTVKDLETGETASAVCSKDDTFDLHTGAFIAMSRLTHFDTDIRLMRLEWEQIESYISDIKMRFGALMGEGYKYPDFDEENEE
nr:MAG TPA: hypothetical protein [Ackermannviridae sp.]